MAGKKIDEVMGQVVSMGVGPKRKRRRMKIRFLKKAGKMGGRGPGNGTGSGNGTGPGKAMEGKESKAQGTLNRLAEVKSLLGLTESPEPPMDGSMEDWEKWAKEVLPKEKEEAKKAPKGVLKKHCAECSVECMQKNIRHFYHVRGDEIPRAVATSYSILRKSCGTPEDAPQMTPKQIVGKAKKD